jgi:hypothetical protein
MNAQQSWLLGWLSCVICLLFTLRCAFVFAKREPQVFLAFTVYAAQWGILIVFYGGKEPNEFLPALSGYLCAIVGSIIYRERLRSKHRLHHHHILRREGLIAYLLLLLALPEALQTPYGSILPPTVNHEDVEVVVTLLLKTIGFYALYKAAEESVESRASRVLTAAPLLMYWLLEAAYTCRWLISKHLMAGELVVMTTGFLVGFSLAKVATVVTFVPAVLVPHKAFHEASLVDKVLLFFHIDTK